VIPAMVALTSNQVTAIVFGTAVLCLLVLALWQARSQRTLQNFKPDFFFWLDLIYIVLLLTVAIMYMGNFYGVKDKIPVILGGILPIGVPWFGAVGATLISMEGLFWHSRPDQWDGSYNYWHMVRPLFGAILAIVAFFIFLVLLNATGQTPAFKTPAAGSSAADLAVFYVLAFLVGYREKNFRALVTDVTNLLFTKVDQPDPQAGPLLVFEQKLPPIPPGNADRWQRIGSLVFPPTPVAGPPASIVVRISNTGSGTLTLPLVGVSTDGIPQGGVFSTENDEVSNQGDLPAGAQKMVQIDFQPIAGTGYTGSLTVNSASLTSPISISLAGEGR
jgi:hypothetical protein